MPAFDPAQLVPVLAGFPHPRRCWLAYSGGMDSSVLLHALAAIRGQLPFETHAVHVNHGLHPECNAWADFCARRCDDLGVPLTLCHVDLSPLPGESIEALARERRYSTMAALMAPRDLLLTAQHQDDQAETLMLALLRGSGVHGLAGMARQADLGGGQLLRPLLDYSRDELAAYANAAGLTWVDDPSNDEQSFDRNFLRHAIFPLLRQRWPSVQRTMARSASHCGEAAYLVDRSASRQMRSLQGSTPGTLQIPGLLALDRRAAKAVLRCWIGGLGFSSPSARHLERILDEVLPAVPDAAPLVAWVGCEVRRYRERLFALPPLPSPPTDAAIIWDREVLELPSGLGCLRRAEAGRPDTALEVRFRLSGLECRPGPDARRKTLKKLYQEAAIPSWLRPYVPLVFRDGELAAVAGVCACGVSGADADRLQVRWTGHPWEGMEFFN